MHGPQNHKQDSIREEHLQNGRILALHFRSTISNMHSTVYPYECKLINVNLHIYYGERPITATIDNLAVNPKFIHENRHVKNDRYKITLVVECHGSRYPGAVFPAKGEGFLALLG
jgi:hypothetical protein